MDENERKAAKMAAQACTPEQIQSIAGKLAAKLNEQFPDFEQISFYFKRAVIETWPAVHEDNGFGRVMQRMQEVMQAHHEHLLHVIYGDHGYADDVQELIYALSVQIYNRINAQASNEKPRYTDRWLECAAELGIEPDELKNSDYICWIHQQIGRKERERQAETMGNARRRR